ncbi:MAG: hydroxyacid dehydrogenase [Phycisphaerales bacterium]|nr:hydroxyacid dehydrogenase [Phycisphaerales bacterium]
MNILITMPDNNLRKMVLHEDSLAKLRSVGNVELNPNPKSYTPQELAEKLKTAEVCITTWGSARFTKAVLQGSAVKLIAHAAGSVQGVVTEDVFETGVKVVSANQAFGKTVAEYNILLHLMAARRSYEIIRNTKTANAWSSNEWCVDGLLGKTVGIIGLGTISRELIKMFKVFDTKILLYSEHCTQENAAKLGVESVPLDRLLRESDTVNVQTSLTQKSYHLLNAQRLALLKDGAIIVNVARGPIIDETALIKELQSKRIFAALDVYDEEPLPENHPLRTLDNVITSPHVGGKTLECRANFGVIVADDIVRFARHEPLQNQVLVEEFRRMTQNVKK